jgi:nicotinamidase/pyrazinamidase
VRTVYFDIDTQLDFLYPGGALYVPGAERIVPAIAALNRHAAASGSKLISTMDAHTENDPTFQTWPPHCVAGTLGQRKPASTLLEKTSRLANEPGVLDSTAPQMLLEKQQNDCFTNMYLAGLLNQLNAGRYVVYGVVTEICVKAAVEGLLKTSKRVELVTDAVRSLDEQAAQTMTKAFTAAGVVVTTVGEVTA